MKKFLTPITLWKNFDDTQPLDSETLFENVGEYYVKKQVSFSGRKTPSGRVRISAVLYTPLDEDEFPAILLMGEKGDTPDERFILPLVKEGYAVLCVDYSGRGGWENCTVYPEDIDYANVDVAEENKIEEEVERTPWYEWTAVARYANRYLYQMKEVKKVGAIGLKTGGEVLWKAMPFANFACFIPVSATGWLAYNDRGVSTINQAFSTDQQRYIAAIESQSYAPFTTCPVLLLCPISNERYNYNRAYETFCRVNEDVDKAIVFSMHSNGTMGGHSLADLYLFLEKYLKGHSVFISEPISIKLEENKEGNLVARCEYDEGGEMETCGIFFSEDSEEIDYREWKVIKAKDEEMITKNLAIIPVPHFVDTKCLNVFTFANYTNGFSVTSRILHFAPEKTYRNTMPHSRVLFNSLEGENGFFPDPATADKYAGVFTHQVGTGSELRPGYGGIKGVVCMDGVVNYRVGDPGYGKSDGVDLKFDLWAEEDCDCFVEFVVETDGVEKRFRSIVKIEGGGKWKRIILTPADFKSEFNAPLDTFANVSKLFFYGNVLINNVLWL